MTSRSDISSHDVLNALNLTRSMYIQFYLVHAILLVLICKHSLAVGKKANTLPANLRALLSHTLPSIQRYTALWYFATIFTQKTKFWFVSHARYDIFGSRSNFSKPYAHEDETFVKLSYARKNEIIFNYSKYFCWVSSTNGNVFYATFVRPLSKEWGYVVICFKAIALF